MTLQTSGTETMSENSSSSGSYDSFDDIGDDTYQDPAEEGGDAFDFEEESPEDDAVPLFKRQQTKDDKKKAKGQKGDDLEALEVAEGLEDSEESEEPTKKDEDAEETEEEAEEGKEEAKDAPKDAEKPAKGKKIYMKIGEETFAVDSNALIPHKVDGKPVQVPLQELLNNYSGKEAWDKRMNEANIKNLEVQKKEQAVQEINGKVMGFVKDIMSIVENPEADPEEILEKIADYYENNIDGKEIDLYALKERSFKSKLQELAKVLNMEDADRRAYFLEKQKENLLKQAEKRKAKTESSMKLNTYREKANALRKSYGVSEAQYVDALEELRSFGHEDKDISEQNIVEWAATKPHRAEVHNLLEPFRDQISDESYGEIVWSLSHLLREGKETPQSIQAHIEEVFGLPTEVKEISEKLSPVGRKKATTQAPTPKKSSYESFDDFEDD